MAGNNIISDKNKIFSQERLNWKGATQLGSGCFAKVYRGLFATIIMRVAFRYPFILKRIQGYLYFYLNVGLSFGSWTTTKLFL